MRIEMDKIYCGDSLQVLQTLPENAVDCCVTSPPYYALRDYGADGQIGREATPEEYVSRITAVFHEVKRVLTPEGTCWLNIADTYCGTGSKADHQDPKYPKGRNGQQVAFNHRAPGCKPKDLIGMLFTYPVAGAPDKVIALLVGMVLFVVNEANRVENQVIMQMVFIDVSCQNKLILAA